MRMHGYHDPSRPNAETGIVALRDDEAPRTSELLDQALLAGASIGTTLDAHTQAHLDPEAKAWLDACVARAAAAGAYGGMALWALNAFTARSEPTGRLAEVLAGIGLGLISARAP